MRPARAWPHPLDVLGSRSPACPPWVRRRAHPPPPARNPFCAAWPSRHPRPGRGRRETERRVDTPSSKLRGGRGWGVGCRGFAGPSHPLNLQISLIFWGISSMGWEGVGGYTTSMVETGIRPANPNRIQNRPGGQKSPSERPPRPGREFPKTPPPLPPHPHDRQCLRASEGVGGGSKLPPHPLPHPGHEKPRDGRPGVGCVPRRLMACRGD